MLRSLWLLFVYLSFLGLGTQAPFILTLGYIWVDTFQPQGVAYIILNQLPVAMIMGAAAVGSYLLLDRRSPPRLTIITVLQISLAVWVTMTTLWAVLPDAAWEKWDWAFKTLVFTAFIPFVIRTRVHIESFIQVYVFSLMANLVPFGLKMAISGGGYGQSLGLAGGNTGLGEGATLAGISVMVIPLLLFLRQHAQLVPSNFMFRQMYLGLSVLAVLTSIGTFERTGLVGLLVLGGAIFLKSRRKIMVAVIGTVAVAGIMYTTTSAWNARISTIGNYQQDGSAMTRILVWKWTLDYVSTHPLGGGFMMYGINHIEHAPDEEHPAGTVEFGRAFHSVYFEVLGEHGWPGIAMFLGIAVASLVALQRAARQVKGIPELRWAGELASSLQVSLVVLLACCAFIGIAFQPWLHYLFAMSVSLPECVRRMVTARAAQTGEVPPSGILTSWRSRAVKPAVGIAAGGPIPFRQPTRF